jgi:hypothetical protein
MAPMKRRDNGKPSLGEIRSTGAITGPARRASSRRCAERAMHRTKFLLGGCALLLLIAAAGPALAEHWWPNLPKPFGCCDDYCPKQPPAVPPLACPTLCDDYCPKAPPAPPCPTRMVFPDDYCAKPMPVVAPLCPGPLSTCGPPEPGHCARPPACLTPWPAGPR